MATKDTDSMPPLAPPADRVAKRTASTSPGAPWPALLFAAVTKPVWSVRTSLRPFACGVDEDAKRVQERRGDVEHDRLLRHIEHDAVLSPAGDRPERPVLHVVNHELAAGAVDTQPQPSPPGDLDSPGYGTETHPAAQVAGGRDALHQRTEA